MYLYFESSLGSLKALSSDFKLPSNQLGRGKAIVRLSRKGDLYSRRDIVCRYPNRPIIRHLQIPPKQEPLQACPVRLLHDASAKAQ